MEGSKTITGRIIVTGEVNLILCDGATLNAQMGITVEDSGSNSNTNILNIYGQAAGTGQLVATSTTFGAGIGGGTNGNGGEVAIHGGRVTATGYGVAAGIGGGGGTNGNGGNGGKVTIYGGRVTATGRFGGAGIGGGNGGSGGPVTVFGGTVIATGKDGAPGIGAGIGAGYGNTNHQTLDIKTGVALYGGSSADTMNLIPQNNNDYARSQYMTAGAAVTGVSLNETSKEISVGETLKLTATVSPENAVNKKVTWSVTTGTDGGKVELYSDSSCSSKVGTDATSTLTVYAKGLAAGTATVTVASAEDNTKSATCTVTVNKATPSVTAPTAKNRTYDGTSQPLVEGGSATGGTLVYSLDGKTYSDKIPTGKDAGEYTVYYKVDGGDNYNDVAAQTVSVTIDKAAATVTADDKSKTSGETDPTLTATVTGMVNGDNIAYTLSRASGEAVGKYAITASGAAEQGNYAVTFVPGTLTINAKSGGETGGGTVTPDPVKPDGNNSGNGTDNGNTDNGNGKDSGNGESGKTDSLTEEQKSAVEEAKQEQKQETEQKAQEAEEVAKTVDDSTDGGKSLADLMSGKNTDVSKSKEETQAAALEVKEEIEKSGLDVSEMSAYEVKKAVENTAQAREDKVDEAAGNVKDPTVPAATNLMTKSDNAALNNADLSVSPKVVTPVAASQEEAKETAKKLDEAAKQESGDNVNGVDKALVQAAANNMNSSGNITIKPVPVNVVEQAKAVEELITKVIETLRDQNEVLASALPEMTAQEDGFYLLNINLRHLLPGQELQLRLSAEDYNGQQTAGKVAAAAARQASLRTTESGAALAWSAVSERGTVASQRPGKEGDHFFLDENDVPTKVVRGDASKMKVVAYLKGNKTYNAFITVAATEADKTELETLATELNSEGNGSSAPTSDKGSGGCDAGLGGLALLALLGLIARKRK